MKFEIAIPSKGRAGLITSQKIFKSATLYIPESELMQYSVYSNKIVTIPMDVKGITATRNWILKYNHNKNVFFLDDDLQYGGYVKRTDEKYKVLRIEDENIYVKELKKLFEVAEQSNSKILGLFTVGNNLTNYAYSPFLFNGVCLGSCMGIINDGTYYFDESFEVKEDYELTLRHLTERGINVRSNILFMQHEHTQTKGGCRDSKRIEKEKSAIKKLIKMYPGMIKEAKHRGTNFSIQLNV
jgi:glycosyltransferase involved in cell wall biosynthesis